MSNYEYRYIHIHFNELVYISKPYEEYEEVLKDLKTRDIKIKNSFKRISENESYQIIRIHK